jgi:hypothetical protein
MTDKTKGRDTMRVGYVRCSTIEQNEARQLKMMEEQKAEKLFIDKASGKNTDRTAGTLEYIAVIIQTEE